VRGTQVEVPPHTGRTATAECNSDEFVTGGAYIISGLLDDAVYNFDFAFQGPPPGWSVRIANDDKQNLGLSLGLQAVVECAKLVDVS
jgi:hypothetical protein